MSTGPYLPNSERLRKEGLIKDVEALDPQQQKAIESLTDAQVDNLVDLFKHFRTNHPGVSFPPDLGDGPASDII